MNESAAMQILKLWLKISTLLAIIGWLAHTLNPELAARVGRFFHKTEIHDTDTEPEAEADTARTYRVND